MVWLRVPGVARYRVADGREIRIAPEPGADDDSIRVFLLGSAFAALLFQRGLLVLHGNAIRIGDRCLVCSGHSGAGKSTLAAGFLRRGYHVLADDVVPVDETYRALPGFPRIKLWQETADRLGIDTTGLPRVRPGLDKFSYSVADRFTARPLPIRWMYVLENDDQDAIRLETIRGIGRFQPLYENTHRAPFIEGMALRPEHLRLCGQLAARIHLVRVTRPRQGFALDALIDRILADVEVAG